MAEDSGAFKTNSANWGRTPAFVMICGAPWQRCLTAPETLIRPARRRIRSPIFNNGRGYLRYSQNNLIRCVLLYPLRREHANFVVTAFPPAQRAFAEPLRRWNSHL